MYIDFQFLNDDYLALKHGYTQSLERYVASSIYTHTWMWVWCDLLLNIFGLCPYVRYSLYWILIRNTCVRQVSCACCRRIYCNLWYDSPMAFYLAFIGSSSVRTRIAKIVFIIRMLLNRSHKLTANFKLMSMFWKHRHYIKQMEWN